MEININDTDKIIEIWLTNGEKRDSSLRASLKPVYKYYKNQKYTIAVFNSGESDLYESTLNLILHNRTNSLISKTQKASTGDAR